MKVDVDLLQTLFSHLKESGNASSEEYREALRKAGVTEESQNFIAEQVKAMCETTLKLVVERTEFMVPPFNKIVATSTFATLAGVTLGFLFSVDEEGEVAETVISESRKRYKKTTS